MIIRLFDIFFSCFGIIILSPVLLGISLWIKLDSDGPVFYRQVRVGRFGMDFRLFKFRTMFTGSDKKGYITIGKDSRITRAGRFIRKNKLDEFPQLFNVIIGDMSLVGPRPDVRKYVELYTEDQKRILNVRPGISDYASVEYYNESELLGLAENPEKYYIEILMPAKINLNMRFVENPGLAKYFHVIFITIKKIIF